MNTIYRLLPGLLILSIAISGFSQVDTTHLTKTRRDSGVGKIDTRSAGLLKISRTRIDWDFDIHINIEEWLENDLEPAVENVMKTIDVALKNLDVHLNSFEASNIHIDIDPVIAAIPRTKIEPIELTLDNLDIDAHRHYRDFDERVNPSGNQDKDTVKIDESKEKSEKKEKEKTKGLRKFN